MDENLRPYSTNGTDKLYNGFKDEIPQNADHNIATKELFPLSEQYEGLSNEINTQEYPSRSPIRGSETPEMHRKCNGFANESSRNAVDGHEPRILREHAESLNQMNSHEYPSPSACPVHEEALPYQTNLFSYKDTDCYPNYHFGLIRGYHREMYDDNTRQEDSLLCCTLDRETVSRIKRRNRVLSWQVVGILFGAAFVFFGVASLAISYIISSDETKDLVWRSLDIPSMYIRIIAILGLTILTLGSALISLCLLVPIFLGRIHGQDMPGFWCTTGDLYVKNAEQTYNLAPNQFLYFDAAVYGNFVGNSNVKKIQPELTNE